MNHPRTSWFLAVFGVAVAGAAFLPMSWSDKAINLGSGLFLVAIGAFAYGIGWSRSRRRRQAAAHLPTGGQPPAGGAPSGGGQPPAA